VPLSPNPLEGAHGVILIGRLRYARRSATVPTPSPTSPQSTLPGLNGRADAVYVQKEDASPSALVDTRPGWCLRSGHGHIRAGANAQVDGKQRVQHGAIHAGLRESNHLR
jgi:hypothetical protein